ncbi:hypothetical protein B2G71_00635 [Novosphingobium sp. PC22D]|uniref:EF-hand domain-containing protein n=1 Tax=Novosphingobium sp. PC22D TaxID=1962403 RepID=UPI000BEFF926|nr:EF-hand domain-containing protein [Novosphingobium sp. PC22D]PEQ14156.1 hypothetical protein B2G71_00635 [Novosphingobium sp. PC22D]
MKILTIGAAAIALATAGTAMAAQDNARPAPGRDRTVTQAEAVAQADAMFTRMDVNKDGKLDQSDRAAAMQQRKEKMFAGLDSDGNGSISREEFMSQDHSGRHGKGMKRGDGPSAKMMGQGRGLRGGMGRHGGMMMGKMADADNDGAVTKAEFDAAVAKHFAMMDGNGDGKVTPEERKAARDAMRAKWKQNRTGGSSN